MDSIHSTIDLKSTPLLSRSSSFLFLRGSKVLEQTDIYLLVPVPVAGVFAIMSALYLFLAALFLCAFAISRWWKNPYRRMPDGAQKLPGPWSKA